MISQLFFIGLSVKIEELNLKPNQVRKQYNKIKKNIPIYQYIFLLIFRNKQSLDNILTKFIFYFTWNQFIIIGTTLIKTRKITPYSYSSQICVFWKLEFVEFPHFSTSASITLFMSLVSFCVISTNLFGWKTKNNKARIWIIRSQFFLVLIQIYIINQSFPK